MFYLSWIERRMPLSNVFAWLTFVFCQCLPSAPWPLQPEEAASFGLDIGPNSWAGHTDLWWSQKGKSIHVIISNLQTLFFSLFKPWWLIDIWPACNHAEILYSELDPKTKRCKSLGDPRIYYNFYIYAVCGGSWCIGSCSPYCDSLPTGPMCARVWCMEERTLAPRWETFPRAAI